MRTKQLIPAATVLFFMGACTVEVENTEPCPDNSYRDGANCVLYQTTATTPDSDGGTTNAMTDSGPPPADMGESDAGTVPDAAGPITFPFAIDNVGYAPSGFFGDGATPGAIAMANACPQRAGDEEGLCHDITWTPGIGSSGFAGVFWQYPANNFGEQPGLKLPEGATALTFWAWGAQGGEQVEFFSGLEEAVDGYRASAGVVTLTDMPTEYTISMCDATYDDVASAFGWVAADATDPITFYVDDIVMRQDETDCGEPSGALTLPFWMDSDEAGYVPSGFMGDTMGLDMDNECPERPAGADGLCHRATWTPTPSSPGWAGVYWQYPENNWGTMPGRDIAPGATAISFYAWSDTGGEVVTFGTGYAAEDGFNRTSGEITLTDQPTPYTIDLTGLQYDDVRGGFSWSSAQSGGLTFYIDDLHWE